MFDLKAVQQSLRDFGLDGWLFYDFRGSNILTRRVLELDPKGLSSRRFSTLCRRKEPRSSSCIASRRRARRSTRRQARLPALAGT